MHEKCDWKVWNEKKNYVYTQLRKKKSDYYGSV